MCVCELPFGFWESCLFSAYVAVLYPLYIGKNRSVTCGVFFYMIFLCFSTEVLREGAWRATDAVVARRKQFGGAPPTFGWQLRIAYNGAQFGSVENAAVFSTIDYQFIGCAPHSFFSFFFAQKRAF